MSDDERDRIIRIEEQIKGVDKSMIALEKKFDGLVTKLWGGMSIGVGWAILKLLEMIGSAK